jgi:membrane protein
VPQPLKPSILERRPVRPEFQRGLLGRYWRFVSQDIWAVDLRALPRIRAALYRVVRILFLTTRSFVRDDCFFRAAALTYITVLSLVPLLAFAFSVLKGLGYYDRLVEQRIRPWLHDLFGGEAVQLRQAIDTVLDKVRETDVSGLGLIGIVILVWAVIRLLGTMEGTFNQIWGIRRPRSPVRRLSDYMTMVIVMPMLLGFAIGTTTAAQNIVFVEFLERYLRLGDLLRLVLGLMPLFFGWAAFTLAYMALPNARTRFASAVLGGGVGGGLWYLALLLHVKAQIGIAGYEVIYAGFAAIPIFLIWVQVSWVIVLLGAELAFAHQNEPAYSRIANYRASGQFVRRKVALRAMTRICRAFLSGTEPPSAEGIALELKIPTRSAEDVLSVLRDAGIIVAADPAEAGIFLPACDPSRITIKGVVDALDGKAEGHSVPARTAVDREVDRLLARMEEEVEASSSNRTLRELAMLDERESEQAAARAAEDGARAREAGEPRVQPS